MGKEKFTKKEVNYQSPAQGMNHCKDCLHFQAGASERLLKATSSRATGVTSLPEKQFCITQRYAQ